MKLHSPLCKLCHYWLPVLEDASLSEASQHVFHLSRTTATAASLQTQRTEISSNQQNFTGRRHENKTVCTFKSGYLPCLCFGQAFLTSVSGQCQRDTTAAQQKANLLTSCILRDQRRWTKSGSHWQTLTNSICHIMINYYKHKSSETMWELWQREKEGRWLKN